MSGGATLMVALMWRGRIVCDRRRCRLAAPESRAAPLGGARTEAGDMAAGSIKVSRDTLADTDTLFLALRRIENVL